MINLNTCDRAEFKEHEANLQGFIKHLEEELHSANLRLQEYEGIQTKDEKEAEFERFWKRHQCHGNRKTTRARYLKLSKKNKDLIEMHHPKYVKATHKAAYPTRKYGEVYISKEAWFDEIPQAIQNNSYTAPPAATGSQSFVKGKINDMSKKVDPSVVSERIAKLKQIKG